MITLCAIFALGFVLGAGITFFALSAWVTYKDLP
jgi:hypothetical protein